MSLCLGVDLASDDSDFIVYEDRERVRVGRAHTRKGQETLSIGHISV